LFTKARQLKSQKQKPEKGRSKYRKAADNLQNMGIPIISL